MSTLEKNKSENHKNTSPSQEQLRDILGHYQAGRLKDAEKLAISISQEFPNHQFAWKALGVIFAQTGRNSEAVHANQTAVSLSPQDAEAHSNLGNVLKELGKLDEALASYKQAIVLNPSFAEAHYNLGITFKAQGRLDEALASYKQAIVLNPSFAEAHSNFGSTLQELGRLEEAKASWIQAITLKPDFVDGAQNLVKLPVGQLDSDDLNLCEKTFEFLVGSQEYQIKSFFFQGNLLKHRGFIEQAFNLFCKANKLKFAVDKGRVTVDAMKINDSLMRIEKWAPRVPVLDVKRLAKLFIIGPSKSGKSSIEHILNESSNVKTLYEIIKHDELVKNIGCEKDSSEPLFENLFYQSESNLFSQDYRVVTSTNPGSIFYSDYLLDMLPNTYFIIVKRDFRDIAPEIFTSEYNIENFFSYDANEISKYLDFYFRVYETLALKVPDRCLTVSFEDIIQTPEDVVDQISRLVGSSINVKNLKQNVASFEYKSLFRNHYAAMSKES